MKKLKNIMLIDDNIHANYFNEIKLQQNNACDKITIFMNGKEALDYLVNNKETDVDLILLDSLDSLREAVFLCISPLETPL